MLNKIRKFILGQPLATRAVAEERLSNIQGLAIFGADALSSTAYATEEILLVLAGAGSLALVVSIPIAFLIAAFILLVSISYTQVIHAYPQGGGVYNVARKNLGEYPSLLGAASLLVDYVLTVSVSVAAGVAAITSAFPSLFLHRVLIGILIILFLMWANLRGVRESGKLFSVPTYIFILMFLGMIGYGLFRHVQGTFPIMTYEGGVMGYTSVLGLILVFRAFASGCTAMTGIEATSNGVMAFRAPESKNASKTLIALVLILGIIFVGVTFLAYWGKIVPVEGETVISQISRLLFGRSWFYFLVQGVTALILLLAANTPFAGFPRVASQLANDKYFPRQFFNLGSKLVFANGIMVLAFVAAFLIYLFQGSVHALIPLYAVGVFLGFSLSQLGMIIHWRDMEGDHRKNILLNAVGFTATSVVFLIVFFSKFTEGAWILVPTIIFLIFIMKQIERHYIIMERTFRFEAMPLPKIMPEKLMVLLVSDFNWGALYALKLIQSFHPAHIRAVHIAVDEKRSEELKEKWNTHDTKSVPLDTVVSEYRDLIGTTLEYIKKIQNQWHNDEIIVVIPEVIPPRIWHIFLHNQTAIRLRLAIEQDPDIHVEIFSVPVKPPANFINLPQRD